MKHTLIALALAASTAAQAGYFSGNELLERLNGEHTNPARYGAAQGYVIGVVDAFDGTAFCIPGTVRAGQLIDITRNTLQASPAERHENSGALYVVAGLMQHFPCQQQRQERY